MAATPFPTQHQVACGPPAMATPLCVITSAIASRTGGAPRKGPASLAAKPIADCGDGLVRNLRPPKMKDLVGTALSTSDRIVFGILCEHANANSDMWPPWVPKAEGFAAWPSVCTIARIAQLTDRGVQKILRRLEAANVVRCIFRSLGGAPTRKGDRPLPGRSSCYLITPNRVHRSWIKSSPEADAVVESSTEEPRTDVHRYPTGTPNGKTDNPEADAPITPNGSSPDVLLELLNGTSTSSSAISTIVEPEWVDEREPTATPTAIFSQNGNPRVPVRPLWPELQDEIGRGIDGTARHYIDQNLKAASEQLGIPVTLEHLLAHVKRFPQPSSAKNPVGLLIKTSREFAIHISELDPGESEPPKSKLDVKLRKLAERAAEEARNCRYCHGTGRIEGKKNQLNRRSVPAFCEVCDAGRKAKAEDQSARQEQLLAKGRCLSCWGKPERCLACIQYWGPVQTPSVGEPHLR